MCGGSAPSQQFVVARAAAGPPSPAPLHPALRVSQAQGLKRKLEAATSVSAQRMKLLGLKAKGGKPAGDEATVADLALKAGQKILMMG